MSDISNNPEDPHLDDSYLDERTNRVIRRVRRREGENINEPNPLYSGGEGDYKPQIGSRYTGEKYKPSFSSAYNEENDKGHHRKRTARSEKRGDSYDLSAFAGVLTPKAEEDGGRRHLSGERKNGSSKYIRYKYSAQNYSSQNDGLQPGEGQWYSGKGYAVRRKKKSLKSSILMAAAVIAVIALIAAAAFMLSERYGEAFLENAARLYENLRGIL